METNLVFDLLTLTNVWFILAYSLVWGLVAHTGLGGGLKCSLKLMFWHCVVTNGGGKQGLGIP
jgi:hypothetical protein